MSCTCSIHMSNSKRKRKEWTMTDWYCCCWWCQAPCQIGNTSHPQSLYNQPTRQPQHRKSCWVMMQSLLSSAETIGRGSNPWIEHAFGGFSAGLCRTIVAPCWPYLWKRRSGRRGRSGSPCRTKSVVHLNYLGVSVTLLSCIHSVKVPPRHSRCFDTSLIDQTQ